MPVRKIPLVTDHYYHIFNRGVNRSPIFSQAKDYYRFLSLINYCRYTNYPLKFSQFKNCSQDRREEISKKLKDPFATFVAYCLMPNHFHFVMQQKRDEGISAFMNRLLTSYTKFFNKKYDRSGPLFEGRFKAVLVETDGQLAHLVRYIHLNPYSSALVKKPVDVLSFQYSSMPEYLNRQTAFTICEEKQIVVSQFPKEGQFEKFTLDQADYQKRLHDIKHLAQE